MPYPNEHAARIKNPDDFKGDTFVKISGGGWRLPLKGKDEYKEFEIPENIDVIAAVLKSIEGDTNRDVQALRFPTKNWTYDETKEWLDEREIDYILLEKAEPGKEASTTGPVKNNKRTMKYDKMQERVYDIKDLKFRAVEEGDQKILQGYAALYNVRSKLLYNSFYEVIDRGAFDEVLQSKDLDVVLNFNHDNSLVMGRTKNGTLTLSSDQTGLFFRAVLPDTSYANDVYKLVQRGDIFQNSFAFMPSKDGYTTDRAEDGHDLITVTKIDKLRDVSAVTFPAYAETSLQAREDEDKREMVEVSKELLMEVAEILKKIEEFMPEEPEDVPEDEPTDEPVEDEPVEDTPEDTPEEPPVDDEEEEEMGDEPTEINKFIKLK